MLVSGKYGKVKSMKRVVAFLQCNYRLWSVIANLPKHDLHSCVVTNSHLCQPERNGLLQILETQSHKCLIYQCAYSNNERSSTE